MPRRVRTFIAVEMAPPIRRRLGDLQRRLQDAAEGVKWVRPENIHLTLKFLGDVEEPSLYEVCRIAQRVGEHHSPIRFQVSGVGAFPNPGRPRVVWAGVSDGAQELTAVRDELEEAFEEMGFRPEARRFTPHLTLGRFRHRSTNLTQVLQEHDAWTGGEMTARELLVLSSELRPEGPEYTVVGRAKLRP